MSPSYANQIGHANGGLERLLRGVIGINNALDRDFLSRAERQFEDSGFLQAHYPRLLKRVRDDPVLRRKILKRCPELLEGAGYCETLEDPMRRQTLTRTRNKLLLQLRNGLEVDPDRVLFTMIHRLVDQKGFRLQFEASEGVFKTLGFQGLLGGPVSYGDQASEQLARRLTSLAACYPASVCVQIGFQDMFIPLLCSDVFLMPSLYEPGGIVQLEAFACGCLVVARATGGLLDTVHPLRTNGDGITGNGWLFTDFIPACFFEAMKQCAEFFSQADLRRMYQARISAQRSVHYWDEAARRYHEAIYALKAIIA